MGQEICAKPSAGSFITKQEQYKKGMDMALQKVRSIARSEHGQATTEYAILVGVLVVIAIIAIVAFRGRISELWQAITDGINSL